MYEYAEVSPLGWTEPTGTLPRNCQQEREACVDEANEWYDSAVEIARIPLAICLEDQDLSGGGFCCRREWDNFRRERRELMGEQPALVNNCHREYERCIGARP